MANGLKWNITVDGTVMNFKSLDIRETASTVDKSSKLNPDGSVNIGYTSTAGDLGTLFITIDELIEDEGVLSSIAYFEAGVEYDAPYVVSYDGVALYSGAAFFVSDLHSSGSVPGEARTRFMFQSNGPYAKA
jgi:hypothetical protein